MCNFIVFEKFNQAYYTKLQSKIMLLSKCILILPVGSSLWATRIDKSLLEGLPSLEINKKTFLNWKSNKSARTFSVNTLIDYRQILPNIFSKGLKKGSCWSKWQSWPWQQTLSPCACDKTKKKGIFLFIFTKLKN